MEFKQLSIDTIALYGKHLIEASAGTGKTYNITRLYLRLLLEREIPVENILVMTFTKDATEELRGRIDSLLRDALANWQTLISEDPLFIHLASVVPEQKAIMLLNKALLYLDEAAIFTIHGFCQRALNEYAFESGLSFATQLADTCQDIVVQCCQDWYRQLSLSADEQRYEKVARFWETPEKFITQFSPLLSSRTEIDVTQAEQISDQFKLLVHQSISALQNNKAQLFEWLVLGKKDHQIRSDEYDQLLLWLQRLSVDINIAAEKMPANFIRGQRYARAKFKQELLALIQPVLMVKTAAEQILDQIAKAEAFAIVQSAIQSIRDNIQQQKQQQNVIGFNDLISLLADQLSDKKLNNNNLAEQLFAQYPVALIDEFQDTDVDQFAIVEAIYQTPTSAALYLIGDPKQAIYGFRGGDIFAYLAARDFCQYHWLMDTNWRSTTPMITGYNRLFYGNELSQASADVFSFDIAYHPVKSSGKIVEHAVIQSDQAKALQFVHFDIQTDDTANTTKQRKHQAQGFRPIMATWCAHEVLRLLSASADDNNESLQPKDIAVLVRSKTEAEEIKAAFDAVKLPSVFLSNKANLFQSSQCQALLDVLKGVLFVEDERLFIAALAGPLINTDAKQLYALEQDDLALQTLRYSFVKLREQWQKNSFISMALMLLHEHFQIASADKDRTLTNIIHLFELLQSASQKHRQPQALLFWFEQQIASDNPEMEAELRLESDEDLIKIVTQHGSKGLEYPVVFIPFACKHQDPLKIGKTHQPVIRYHDQQFNAKICLMGDEASKQMMADESYAESVRLLYVAVTRAKQRCYVLTTPFEQVQNSPLGKTLQLKNADDLLPTLSAIAEQNSAAIGLQLVDPNSLVQTACYQGKTTDLTATVAKFSGYIERDWWLSSFTALSRNVHQSGLAQPDRDIAEQNQQLAEQLSKGQSYLPRFLLSKGAHTGNLLHDILQYSDFSAPDWAQTCEAPLMRYGALNDHLSANDLYHWLQQVVETPLTETLSLAALNKTHTLREIEFYFPTAVKNIHHLSNIVQQHRVNVAAQHKISVLPMHLPSYRKIQGMMHGFIDLIFEHDGKFYVCDYKSSHLGDQLSDYKPANLAINIQQNQYDLQYLIYSVALHRYLQQRLPNYDCATHFGGVYYLYLRGMTNDQEHQQCGVYYSQISPDLLQQLDQLFIGDTANV
jgi:exodeoxyribonuclease V beta subunit